MTCDFERTDLDTKVVFNDEGRISGLFFVPTERPAPAVAPPDNVTEQALTVGEGEWALPGTLSRPAGYGQTGRVAQEVINDIADWIRKN